MYQEGYEDPNAADEDVVLKAMKEHACKEDFDTWNKKALKLECKAKDKDIGVKDKGILDKKTEFALTCFLEANLLPVPTGGKDALVKAVWKHLQPKCQ